MRLRSACDMLIIAGGFRNKTEGAFLYQRDDMKPARKHFLLAIAAASITGSARASSVQPVVVAPAVSVCIQATSKLGVDDQSFLKDGWTVEAVKGAPGDRFYSKGDLRASLGMRPSVGGSCIISFNTPSPYNLLPLTGALERTFDTKALASDQSFALLSVAGQVIQTRVTPVPNGSVVSVAVEMQD